MEKSVNFRTLSFLFLSVAIAGCTSIPIPNYIKDVNPYKKVFYADSW